MKQNYVIIGKKEKSTGRRAAILVLSELDVSNAYKTIS